MEAEPVLWKTESSTSVKDDKGKRYSTAARPIAEQVCKRTQNGPQSFRWTPICRTLI
jgi:hypothetical protein